MDGLFSESEPTTKHLYLECPKLIDLYSCNDCEQVRGTLQDCGHHRGHGQLAGQVTYRNTYINNYFTLPV